MEKNASPRYETINSAMLENLFSVNTFRIDSFHAFITEEAILGYTDRYLHDRVQYRGLLYIACKEYYHPIRPFNILIDSYILAYLLFMHHLGANSGHNTYVTSQVKKQLINFTLKPKMFKYFSIFRRFPK